MDNRIGVSEAMSSSELSASQHVREETVDACLILAEQLKELLDEEACALQRFDSPRLLQLLPVKQYLVEGLAERLEPWKTEESARTHVSDHSKRILLKSRLEEINRLNHSNGIFISGTLSFYQDFFHSLCPSSYAPEGRQSSGSKFKPPKGLTFRKEI